ncbi:MAG: hypothetical protein JOZ41_18870 [Chloroflexi bacterium]|nr:hypothetical protein [Chloroflexota bacterium]
MQTTETPTTSTRARAMPHARLAIALQDIVDEYLGWRRDVMPTLPEEEQLFRRTVDGHTIWVLDDGPTFTILCREES